jgi:hypothetical protein
MCVSVCVCVCVCDSAFQSCGCDLFSSDAVDLPFIVLRHRATADTVFIHMILMIFDSVNYLHDFQSYGGVQGRLRSHPSMKERALDFTILKSLSGSPRVVARHSRRLIRRVIRSCGAWRHVVVVASRGVSRRVGFFR